MAKKSVKTKVSKDTLHVPSDVRWVWFTVVVLGGVIAYNFTLQKEDRFIRSAYDKWIDLLKADPDAVVRSAQLAHRFGVRPEHYRQYLMF